MAQLRGGSTIAGFVIADNRIVSSARNGLMITTDKVKLDKFTFDGSNNLTIPGTNLYLGGQATYYMYYDSSNTGYRTVGNFLTGSNIFWGTKGIWLSAWLDQPLLTTTNVTFANLTTSTHAINVTSGTDRYFINCIGTVNSLSIYENGVTPYIDSYAGVTFRGNHKGGSGGYFSFSGGNAARTDGIQAMVIAGGGQMTGGWNKTLLLNDTYPGIVFGSNNTKWASISYDHSSSFIIKVGATTADVYASGISALLMHTTTGAATFASSVTSPNFVSNVVTGTQPYATTSTTLNTNLNADLLDTMHATTANTGNTVMARTAGGDTNVVYINCSRGNETSVAASYIYDTGDGWLRKKTLADTKTEIVTKAAIEAVLTGAISTHTHSAYLTGYTETDTLATVTNRGATTTGNITINGYATGTVRPATGVTTYSGHTSTAANDAAIRSRSNTEDNWIYCDEVNAQYGIYHRNIDTALSVASNVDLPANSIAFIGGNLLTSYICLTDGSFYQKGNGIVGGTLTVGGNAVITTGNIVSQSVTYATNSSKLYSTDAGYAYGSGTPYYGYLTYMPTPSRWRFQVSPATPAAVEVAYADTTGALATARTITASGDATSGTFNGSADATVPMIFGKKKNFSLQASRILTGGGVITVNASSSVFWNQRFIVISSGYDATTATQGYFSIDCPVSGTVTGVGGAANKTATAAGVPLTSWESIYYILPFGSGNAYVAANLRVVGYGSALDIPDNWVKICSMNSDGAYVEFANGISLRPGTSINSNSYDVLWTDISGVPAYGSTTGTICQGDDTRLSNARTPVSHSHTAISDISSLIDTDIALAANSDSKIATQKATKAYVDNILAANDAMIFKGTLGTGGTITAIPTTYNAGWAYKIITAGTYAGVACEVGDLIIAVIDRAGSGNTNADWNVTQTNIDGAVTGPASATNTNFASFNGTGGKIIQDSGYSAGSFATSGHTHNVFTHIHAYSAGTTDVANSPFTAASSTGHLQFLAGTNIALSMDATGAITIGLTGTVANATAATQLYDYGNYAGTDSAYPLAWWDNVALTSGYKQMYHTNTLYYKPLSGILYATSFSGSGVSLTGVDADKLDGQHGSYYVNTTYNSSLNADSRNSRGVTRLYRSDDNSDYSVQASYDSTRWLLRGYSADTFHAACRVEYADVAGSAANVTGGNLSGNLVANNYGLGNVGLYNSSLYQAVWAMGTAYILPAGGATTGTLYGLAWTHPNAGGQSKAGLSHQLLIVEAGVTKTAIGTGIWTAGTITGNGSGLTSVNAETVDTLHSTSFLRSDATNSDIRVTGTDGLGLKLYDSDACKIQMAAVGNSTYGGRLDSTSDYNMYFTMGGGTNRGFVFRKNNGTSQSVAQIDSTGMIYTSGGLTICDSSGVPKFKLVYNATEDSLETIKL